jgi:uncharacterized membrane protein YvbJ
MFCPECGSENPDDARFCGSCGKPLSVADNAPASAPSGVTKVIDPSSPQEQVPAGLKYGILGASLFIPLLGVIMGIVYMVKGESEDKKAVGRLWLYAGIGIAFFYVIAGSGL